MFNQVKNGDLFERLENECNNDFQLLDELGPSYFSADHLMEMHHALRGQVVIFERRQRLTMILGGTAVGWILISFPALYFQYLWIALATAVAGMLCLVGFFGLLFWQKKQFTPKSELEYNKRIIEEELRHRAQKRREKKF